MIKLSVFLASDITVQIKIYFESWFLKKSTLRHASGAGTDRLTGLTEDSQNLRNCLKIETLVSYEICPFETILSSVSQHADFHSVMKT